MSNNRRLFVRYLPLQNYHIAPLADITPDALLEATDRLLNEFRGSEEIERNTVLHFLVKRMGINGGFGDFKVEFEKLQEFMRLNGLEKRYDVITPRHDLPIVKLKPRQVADRIFFSGQPLPERIFTGYDFDWGMMNDRWYMRNSWQNYPSTQPEYLPYDVVVERSRAAESQAEDLLEAAVEHCRTRIGSAIANLLGDVLLSHHTRETKLPHAVLKIYKHSLMTEDDVRREEKIYREAARIFYTWINQQAEGWVHVIPYNTSLIFLKGKFGEYDFLVRGFRDEPFVESFFPHLQKQDVPWPNPTASFKRWLYFRYEGWLEKDEHEAEIRFYADGGRTANYPGPDEVLRNHLAKNRDYAPWAPETDGFHAVTLNGTAYCVSDLITIREFREFMASEKHYAEYSRRPGRVDRWETVNSDDNESLPASVITHRRTSVRWADFPATGDGNGRGNRQGSVAGRFGRAVRGLESRAL
jgi:hypothetical protein